MKEFLSTLKENWFEILTALSTIIAIFITRGKAGKVITKTEAEQKVARLEKKLEKDIKKVKKDNEKLESAKKELNNVNSSNESK